MVAIQPSGTQIPGEGRRVGWGKSLVYGIFHLHQKRKAGGTKNGGENRQSDGASRSGRNGVASKIEREASGVRGLTQVKQEGLRRDNFKGAFAQRSLESFDALCGGWSGSNKPSGSSAKRKR